MNRRIFFYLLFILCVKPQPVFSQEKTTDSLKLVLQKTNTDTAKLRILEILVAMSNEDDFYDFSLQIKAIAEKELQNKQMPDNLKKDLLHSLAGALNNIGLVYKRQGNLATALDYYHQSLKICEESGAEEGAGHPSPCPHR